MLIERYLPRYDASEVHEIQIDAPPAVAYEAIRTADISDPLITALFSIREFPNRITQRLRGTAVKPAPRALTFADMATAEMGFVLLAEDPGVEFVVGSVGRFWKRDYGWHRVAPADFTGFSQPGYAKLVVAFSVRPSGVGGSIVRYEARTATTDPVAHKRFARYWRVIRPGVAIVMARALRRIKAHAERPRPSIAGDSRSAERRMRISSD